MSFQRSNTNHKKKWHTINTDDLMSVFHTSPDGLKSDEARKRIETHGSNRLEKRKGKSCLKIFTRQFLNPLVFILLVASFLKLFIDKPLDSIVLFATILIMVLIGFFQEWRAEKSMNSLNKLYSRNSKVKRDNKVEIINSNDIAPGDIILLEAGDQIPADCRIVDCNKFRINESSLTGESATVEKNNKNSLPETPLAERKNMVYAGTTVSTGKATVLCVATAMDTELGKIALAIQDIKQEKTPLQKSIHSLSVWMSCFVLIIIMIFIGVSLYKGFSFVEIILFAISAAIAAIPEGLPVAVTIVLAKGMQVMAKRKALARKLIAVETLGSTTVIASDKTGTLTLNQMTVVNTYVHRNNTDRKKLLFEIGILANDAHITKKEENYEILGDPTEAALLIAAEKEGIDQIKIVKSNHRLEEIPFESENRYMATLCKTPNGKMAYVKGSPEKLIQLSNLEKKDREEIEKAMHEYSSQGLRLLAVACAPLEKEAHLTEDVLKGHLDFIGLFAILDPPRDEAIKSIKACHQAGIRVIMITGDNKVTAEAIAKKIGIDSSKGALSSEEINLMSEESLSEKVKYINVFARIEPLHKLKIVRALKNLGHVVAMTGDGVNDAPALQAADIGIAMGITGTDVAKESSNMILLDDNFSSIEAAVEEGRAIFNRLRYVIAFLLTTCLGELFGIILSITFTDHVYLIPLQILWVNLITGVIVAIPLAVEPKTGDELNQPPRSPDVKLVYPGMVLRILFLSIMLGASTFTIYYNILPLFGLKTTRTIVFTSLVVFEWLIAFNVRSDEKTVFQIGFFSNRALLYPILLGLILQIIILYLPLFQIPFQTTPLKINEWLLVLIPGVFLFAIETLRKVFFPKMFNYGKWKKNKRVKEQLR